MALTSFFPSLPLQLYFFHSFKTATAIMIIRPKSNRSSNWLGLINLPPTQNWGKLIDRNFCKSLLPTKTTRYQFPHRFRRTRQSEKRIGRINKKVWSKSASNYLYTHKRAGCRGYSAFSNGIRKLLQRMIKSN